MQPNVWLVNMGELSQGRDTGKLPLLDAARRSTNPVIKPQKLLPSDDFSALNNKVDALASHLYSNDMRMNRLEEYIRRLEGGQPVRMMVHNALLHTVCFVTCYLLG